MPRRPYRETIIPFLIDVSLIPVIVLDITIPIAVWVDRPWVVPPALIAGALVWYVVTVVHHRFLDGEWHWRM